MSILDKDSMTEDHWSNNPRFRKTSMTEEDEEFNRIEREASLRMAAVRETVSKRHWVGLMRGVRVEGDTVVITVKGGNEEARCLCGELINEMEMRS
jgi:hypothetical protein